MNAQQLFHWTIQKQVLRVASISQGRQLFKEIETRKIDGKLKTNMIVHTQLKSSLFWKVSISHLRNVC